MPAHDCTGVIEANPLSFEKLKHFYRFSAMHALNVAISNVSGALDFYRRRRRCYLRS
jgi:hypothetical protein